MSVGTARFLRRRIVLSATLCAIAAGMLYAVSSLLGTEGLVCEDFPNAFWQPPPIATRIQPDLTERLLGSPLLGVSPQFSTICHGWLFVTSDGRTTFLLDSDDGSDLSIDGIVIVDDGGVHGESAAARTIALTPGPRRIQIRYSQQGGDYAFSLLSGPEGEPLRPLDSAAISQRPLTRVEYRLRLLAQPARPTVFLVFAALLAACWRRELVYGSRLVVSRLVKWHDAVVPDSRRALGALLAIAIGARVILSLVTHAILWPDSESYYATAVAIRHGDWLSHEILRTPVFPMFMAPFLTLSAAGVFMIAVQRLLGIVATAMLYRIGRRAFLPATAFYGTLLWTLSPLQLYYETAITTEALFVFLVIFAVWATARFMSSAAAWSWALVGFLCGLATLTRPVGKAFILIVVAVACWHARSARRMATLAGATLAAYMLCVVPWMEANSRSYGFFGISRGEGLGLFMRAFDIERMTPPQQTAYPDVKETFEELHARTPYLHYRLRDELHLGRGYSTLRADQAMEGFALEAIREHPVAFATGVVVDWIRLFVSPHRSVDICQSASGPVLCCKRTIRDVYLAFPNTPSPGFSTLKALVARYIDAVYWMVPLLWPLAAFGAVVSLRRSKRDESWFLRLLLAGTIVYFTILAVSFNTVEDRYRLPVDPFILLFAVQFLASPLARPIGLTPA